MPLTADVFAFFSDIHRLLYLRRLRIRRLRMAQSFNRVGNAPRFVFQISNFKLNNRLPAHGPRALVHCQPCFDVCHWLCQCSPSP